MWRKRRQDHKHQYNIVGLFLAKKEGAKTERVNKTMHEFWVTSRFLEIHYWSLIKIWLHEQTNQSQEMNLWFYDWTEKNFQRMTKHPSKYVGHKTWIHMYKSKHFLTPPCPPETIQLALLKQTDGPTVEQKRHTTPKPHVPSGWSIGNPWVFASTRSKVACIPQLWYRPGNTGIWIVGCCSSTTWEQPVCIAHAHTAWTSADSLHSLVPTTPGTRRWNGTGTRFRDPRAWAAASLFASPGL